MGFDVFGPTRRVRASNIDDGEESQYDILTMPSSYGLTCPQLEKLNQRFYESTPVRIDGEAVHRLRDELIRLRDTYRARRESELIKERRIRACDPDIRDAILEQVLQEDTVYRILEEFRLLCEEAIAARVDVQCFGD
jgi:hypothetical protein